MLYIIEEKYHGGVNVGSRVVSENFRALSDIQHWIWSSKVCFPPVFQVFILQANSSGRQDCIKGKCYGYNDMQSVVLSRLLQAEIVW
jgi:hypothetical protein